MQSGGGLARAVDVEAARRGNSGLAAVANDWSEWRKVESEWELKEAAEDDRLDPLVGGSE